MEKGGKKGQTVMWVDSHAHLCGLDENEFFAQLKRAENAGVSGIINIATSIEECEKAVVQANMKTSVKTFAAIGICAADCAKYAENFDWTQELERLAKAHKNVVAIGETGIDGANKGGYPPLDVQKKVFGRQIELAIKLNKPLIVHSRMQEEEALEICAKAGVKNALFHCFTGTAESAKKITRAGYYISFSGIVTFVKSGLDETIKAVPDDKILVETDAPWLAPAPFRGKANEPAFVRFTGEKCAQIRGASGEYLAKITKENAQRFFGVEF